MSVEWKVWKRDSLTEQRILDITTITESDVCNYATHQKAFSIHRASQRAAHWLATAAQSWLEAIPCVSRTFLVVLTLLESLS